MNASIRDTTGAPVATTPYAPEGLLFGGDYNPEQWPRETWREDIALMRRAKVNTVTLGVFSWALLEPREGEYDTGWLDEIVGLLDEAGIGFFLATPTASPPPWFTLAHPDAMPVRADGVVLSHGSRDTYAISAPAYRAAARRIARLLGERYGRHPRLRGWHVHNEYGTIDHGPHAATAFRRWLRARYGTIDALNAAWCTAFWSQRYGSWEEILPSRATQYLHNPALAVDFRRFSSDEMLAAFAEQKAEIAAAGSRAPVTTNFMLPTWNHLEQWSWADAQDVVSIDHYLDTTGPDAEAHVAYGSDLTRSWAGGPWVLMEQNARGIRVGDRTFAKSPGRMIRNSLAYIARGSQSSLFFQWRAGAGGAEQWHGALVPHSGGESAAFAAVEELGGMLEALSEVVEPPADGRVLDADVGIVWHADGWWALETPHLPNDAIAYPDEVRATHRSFWRAGIATDFVRPGADASRYRLLVVPALASLPEETAEWLRRYVEEGGRLVVTFLTGVADEHQRIGDGPYPAMLRDLLGAGSEEILPLAPGEKVALDDGSWVEEWTERVVLDEATALASYADGPLAGMPAITVARRGAGTVVYASARLVQESRDRLLAGQAEAAGVSQTARGARERGVEAVRRRGARHDFVFLLHHGDVDVRVVASGADLLSGVDAARGLSLAAGEAAVVRVERDAPVEVSSA
ncbi:beta-galactosidase [Microbacterium betulae]|uniref:Beta-galactosidase n=1 Tax=Microbacterium betulae TaxID=2981139 RepID=A0AA97FJP5_9MICO|nr:beta-galactosidase [Microbacterium sp. AB]WOF24236.1 beta-galactosidase [Microbacterium sp. AB]